MNIRWTSGVALLLGGLTGCSASAGAPMTTPAYPQSTPPTSGSGAPRVEEMSKDGVFADDKVSGNLMGAPGRAPPPSPVAQTKPPTEAPRASGEEPAHDRALLIYTARVTMAVYQVDQSLASVEKIAKDMGGYLSLRRDREITIRVPRDRFDATLAAVDKIGDVLHRDIQAEDVTDQYVDTEIRIKNARAMQVRLKTLLEKAPVKEALEIEKELRRVTDEIELLEGKLKLLKDKIAYSTITVAFEARGVAVQSTRIRLPFPWLGSLGLPTLLRLSEDR